MKKILNAFIIRICMFVFMSCNLNKPFDERVVDFNNTNNVYKQVDVVFNTTYDMASESTETLPSGFHSTYFEYSIIIDYQNLIMCKTFTVFPEYPVITGTMNAVYLAEGNDLIELFVDETGLVLNEHVLNTEHENPESDFAIIADKLAFHIDAPEIDDLSLEEDGSYEIELSFSDLSNDYLDIASDVYKTASNVFYNDCLYIINFNLKEDHFIVTVTADYEDSVTGIINHFFMSYDTYYPESINMMEYNR
jgi:hypothetical protein